jgi:hypothetical protein
LASGSRTAGATSNRKLDAASLVYNQGAEIIRAFDEGAVIRSRRGRFLAIPPRMAASRVRTPRRWSIHTQLSISTLICAGRVLPPRPGFSLQIALPSNATEQLAGTGLPLVPRKQPQARLDHLALGPEAGRRHRLGQQSVVDLDTGSHRNAPSKSKSLSRTI